MKITPLFAFASVFLTPLASSSTVSFSSGDSFTIFQTSAGVALDGGFIHAGYYTGSTVGLSFAELQAGFNEWDTLDSASGASGFFSAGAFDGDFGAEAGRQIYLAVTDTDSVATASEFAVFTNTSDIDWAFPSSELGIPPALSLNDVVEGNPGASLLAGIEGVTDFGAAIQLVAVPEPSVVLLGMLSLGGLLRRRR